MSQKAEVVERSHSCKVGPLALAHPGDKIVFVFKPDANVAELLVFEELDREGVISLGKTRGAISLLIENRRWAFDTVEARTFTLDVGVNYHFEVLRKRLRLDVLESIDLKDD